MFLKPWYRAAAMLEALEDAVLLAIFADIHANRPAFEACLAAPRAEGRADDPSRRLCRLWRRPGMDGRHRHGSGRERGGRDPRRPAPNNAGQIYGFLSTFQNFGGTRTGLVIAWHSIAYYPGAVPYNTDFSKPRNAVENSTGSVAGEVEQALKKEGVIVLWGKLIYSDIYDPKTEHVITFCQTLTPTQNAGSPLIAFAVTPLRGDCNSSI
jgi:hypothetical protein